jgi:hypothetical protein
MNDRELIWEAYLGILNEGTRIKGIGEFSDIEKREVLSKLSDIERGQLGKPSGGSSAKSYMSADDWVRIRDYHLNMAMNRNKETTPDMCAYTPGETLKLLQNSRVQEWFSSMRTFRIPEGKKSVVFVPCAANKRWGDATESQQYKCINVARSNPDVYWVTISEPLGVVPEKHWDDFPMYDNPGLFKKGPHELSTKNWHVKMGYNIGESFLYPFDAKAKQECIKILAGVIREFCEFNKRLNPSLRFIGAVKGKTGSSTHTEMLNMAGIIDSGNMYLSKPEGKGGRYTTDAGISYWKDIEGIASK